jgi:copper chaperone
MLIKENRMTHTTVHIEGMSCQHCVMRVKRALSALPGISDLSVEIGTADVTFDESKIQQADIENAIIRTGYKIKS